MKKKEQRSNFKQLIPHSSLTCSFLLSFLLIFLLSVVTLSCKRPPLDPRIGTSAPDVHFQTLKGQSHQIKTNGDGSIYFIKFWSVNCPVCIQQNEFYKQFEEQEKQADDIKILRVNADLMPQKKQLSAVQNYLKEHRLSWDPVLDNGELLRLFEIRAFPTTVVIGKDGKFIFVSNGLLQLVHLNAILDYARNPEPAS